MVGMDERRNVNRSMFWRVLRHSIFANRGRLFVILLALGAGAAITAALLNLQVDAKRRVTTEFRSFGANVLITPREADGRAGMLRESFFEQIPDRIAAGEVSKAAFLYGVIEVFNAAKQGKSTKAVLAGYNPWYIHSERVISPALAQYQRDSGYLSSDMHCGVGRRSRQRSN
jgi:hypothetical protein